MTNLTEEPQQEESGYIDNLNFLRLRGLPYSATHEDIRKFFGPEVCVVDVYILQNNEGRPSGDAFIQVETDEDMQKALQKHQQHLGKRYIDVFTITDVESNQIVRRMKKRAAASHQGTIRVRGVPFSCTEEELKSFFKDLNVVEVLFGKEPGGRLSGEAYVRFGSKGDAEKASHLSGQYLGRRYLEIFNIDADQFENFKDTMNNPSPVIRGGVRPYNEVNTSDESWSGYGPSPQRRQPTATNNYSSYQKPQIYGTANTAPVTGTYQQQQQQYDPYSYSATNTAYDYSGAGGPRSTTAGYGASQPQYGAPPSRQYGGNDFGNRSYGTNDYGARPYGGSDYGNRPYGAQQNTYGGPQLNAYGGGQHTYSQEMQPGDNKPYQYNNRGSGRIVGGEILNPLKVHMRGLPYRVTAKEIEQFFSPLQIVEIKTGIMEDGRASGDGIVEFNNQVDAQEALSRDKQSIKSRYIELFSHDNAKISGRTTYRSILSRASGGYTARDQQAQGQNKPLFAPW